VYQVDGIDEEFSKLINDLMLDEHGNNKGYFTRNESKTSLMFLPVQDPLHCNEDQAEQTLQAVIDNRMIVEFEPGKYKSTEELSVGEGD
jgi:hypothetical protein